MKDIIRKLFISTLLGLILIAIIYGIFNFSGYGQINFYSLVFAQTIEGEIENVEKVSPGMAIVGGTTTPASNRDLFSFAVGIKAKNGEIITGTSEDRQWAIVKKGQCAKAKFFPYPPWDLDKSGTYYNVRLLKLYECNTGATTLTVAAPTAQTPAASAAQAPTTPPATAAPEPQPTK